MLESSARPSMRRPRPYASSCWSPLREGTVSEGRSESSRRSSQSSQHPNCAVLWYGCPCGGQPNRMCPWQPAWCPTSEPSTTGMKAVGRWSCSDNRWGCRVRRGMSTSFIAAGFVGRVKRLRLRTIGCISFPGPQGRFSIPRCWQGKWLNYWSGSKAWEVLRSSIWLSRASRCDRRSRLCRLSSVPGMRFGDVIRP